MKVYCEHGALSKDLKRLRREGKIQLIHFPYDPNSRSSRLGLSPKISEAQWRDLNCTWEELDTTWEGTEGSDLFSQIEASIGRQNRRDMLHVDTAYKNGCAAMVTVDSDILTCRAQLQALIRLPIFHPEKDREEMLQFLDLHVT